MHARTILKPSCSRLGIPELAGSTWSITTGINGAQITKAFARRRSEWVAYLGHDDIWYPTHLESALRVATEKSADLVAGATILFGPPRSGIRAITGLFRTQELKPPEWAPPSSWVHRRSLVDVAGYWTNPSELSLPADIDFMKRLLAVGACTTCTNELTVFKFNAGRRDTYKIKTNTEQQELLRKVQSGIDFRHDELIDLIRAESLGMTIKIEMPSDEHPAGAVHKWHQRLKGIQPRFSNDELRTASTRQFRIRSCGGDVGFFRKVLNYGP